MSVVRALEAALGPDRVSLDDAARAARRRDEWVVSHLDDLAGRGPPPPACVVRPASTADVAATLRVCSAHRAPVVPFGLGSGVCGAVRATERAVVVDLGAMNRVRSIHAGDLVGCFEAGLRGSDAEAAVAEHGLTLGHAPQSLAISSVGGWVATRSAGQTSTRHGGIEDMLLGLEVVLASGEILATKVAPRAAGPSLATWFVGSEGTLGIVTAVTLSLRRAPEHVGPRALRVPDMASGIALLRELVQRGAAPAVLRLYDAVEAARHFPAHADGSPLAVFVHEGEPSAVAAEVAAGTRIAADAGATEADPAIARAWLAKRFEAPSFRAILDGGIVFDTIEVGARWSVLTSLYESVVASVGEVDDLLAISAHVSHAYRSGASLYFTFGARRKADEQARAAYAACWRRAMEATLAHGGAIAHHHGIGRVRAPWLASELGGVGVRALGALERALDPLGIMNPGVLV